MILATKTMLIKFVPVRFITVIRDHQERVDFKIDDVKSNILWNVSENILKQDEPFQSQEDP